MAVPLNQPHLELPHDLDFSGQVVVVTGATAGIGYAVSEHLLRHNVGHLIIAVRNVSKGNVVKEKLLSTLSSTSKPEVTVLELDLMSYDSVMTFVRALSQKFNKLNTLILNAGFGTISYKLAPTGHEERIQVNLYSNALLALSLIPILKATARDQSSPNQRPSRIVWTGSFTQFRTSITKHPLLPAEQETFMSHFDAKANDNTDRYAETKLLVTAYVESLAEHLNPREVIISSVDPGFVQTNFAENYPFYLKWPVKALMKYGGRTSEEAAITYLHAAEVAGEETHGKFLSDNKIKPYAPFISSPEGREMQKRMWNEIWDECVKYNPEIAGLFS